MELSFISTIHDTRVVRLIKTSCGIFFKLSAQKISPDVHTCKTQISSNIILLYIFRLSNSHIPKKKS